MCSIFGATLRSLPAHHLPCGRAALCGSCQHNIRNQHHRPSARAGSPARQASRVFVRCGPRRERPPRRAVGVEGLRTSLRRARAALDAGVHAVQKVFGGVRRRRGLEIQRVPRGVDGLERAARADQLRGRDQNATVVPGRRLHARPQPDAPGHPRGEPARKSKKMHFERVDRTSWTHLVGFHAGEAGGRGSARPPP